MCRREKIEKTNKRIRRRDTCNSSGANNRARKNNPLENMISILLITYLNIFHHRVWII